MSAEARFRPRVAFVKGDDRYADITKALDLLGDHERITAARKIVVKPNLTRGSCPLSATHVDAVRAVLDYIQEFSSSPVTIAEGAGTGSPASFSAFRSLGYFSLRSKYDVRLVDLNADRWVETEILDAELKPTKVRVAKTIVESDYRISVTPPKTHDCVIVTASLKNLVMGSLVRRENAAVRETLRWGIYLAGIARRKVRALRSSTTGGSGLAQEPPPSRLREQILSFVAKASGNDKLRVHQGFPVMNLNLYRLARFVSPHLAVVDGFEAMEGAGPTEGTAVPLGVAIASADSVAADCLAALTMGFEREQIGYLSYCHRMGLGMGDVAAMDIIGDDWRGCVRRCEPHPQYQAQLNWRIPDVGRYLC
ncbi:MAG: DUF362 domain-containing protein [Chloroflexi bacterium]|nr:DUF362 domain-containing protein [Chloroflexota bacterium]